ncbi:MAG: hypothetical protein COV76_08400 [Candidatus Omnitrophica bacterium CG11_big_fil_rev_8_21_14_0_20_64_10]|nr:MAG: hypothetical protein COV76_08400 [Candidatus Omnitrophica bacterium CG11_big_fil_rev_8_21_14_0_20_64_10]
MGGTTFKVDDMVVHPAYGLCRIHGIDRKRFDGSSEDCYVLMIGHGGRQVEVTISFRQAEAVGIRFPVTSEEALRLIDILQGKDLTGGQMLLTTWEGVEQGLRSGDPFEAARILRQMAVANMGDWEELVEEPLLDNRRSKKGWAAAAVHRLASELAFAQQISVGVMKERFRQWLEGDRSRQGKSRSSK